MGLILAIDPGGKPGYALLDPAQPRARRHFRRPTPRVLATARALPADWGAVAAVVVEGQWIHNQEKAKSILTLSRTAGWQLAIACLTYSALPHVCMVEDWRAALGARSAPKEVLAARCKEALWPDEFASTADEHDAILIGWGWSLIPAPKTWKIPP